MNLNSWIIIQRISLIGDDLAMHGSIHDNEYILARMTQRDIAEILEVEPGTVSKYESGMLEPNIESIKRLSDTFEITIDELLKDDDEYILARMTQRDI